MKIWLNRALALLVNSIESPCHELNELDWKSALSPNTKRLSEHLSALANYPAGGFLVYGVDNNGEPVGVVDSDIENIVNQLTNIGRSSVEPPLSLDFAVEAYQNVNLLFIYVAESAVKPVHLRGKDLVDAYIRSGGTTRQASRQEVAHLMLNSRTPHWEELRASMLLDEAT